MRGTSTYEKRLKLKNNANILFILYNNKAFLKNNKKKLRLFYV